jgi:hypothetical protein
MKLTALQSFSPRGAKLIRQHETFTANEADAEIYIRNGLASTYEESQAPSDIAQIKVDGAPIEVDPMADVEKFYIESELQEKNVTDLKKIAKNKGVSGYTKMSKSELIFAILAHQTANQIENMEE